MALEDRLQSLEERVADLIDVTKTLISLRTDAIETVKSAAAPKQSKKNDDKAKVEADAAPEQADDSAYGEAKALVAEYTTGSDRPEEVQARKAKVKELLRHPKLVKPEMAKVDKFSVTDVMDDKIPVLMKNLKALLERGDLTQPAAADDDLV